MADATREPTPLTSASQVSKWDECQRRWGFQYLAGYQTPQTPAQLLGDEVDKEQLQPYLTTGRAFDYTRDSGYIASSILGYLPKPGLPGLEVQKHFTLPSATAKPGEPAPFGYQGYIDLWLPDGVDMPDVGRRGVPIVSDFKSTSDLKWAKTPATLATDTQAMLYATYAMFATGRREVDLVWLYMQTKGARKAKRVHLPVTGEDVFAQFTRIDKTAVTMKAARDACGRDTRDGAEDAAEKWVLKELAPTPSNCDAYGGCPFRHKCNLGPGDVITALAGKEVMPMSGAATLGLLERLKKEKKAEVGEFAEERKAIVEESAPAVEVLGINPTEKDLPPLPVKVEAEPAPEEKPKRGRQKKDPLGADVFAVLAEALEAAAKVLRGAA